MHKRRRCCAGSTPGRPAGRAVGRKCVASVAAGAAPLAPMQSGVNPGDDFPKFHVPAQITGLMAAVDRDGRIPQAQHCDFPQVLQPCHCPSGLGR